MPTYSPPGEAVGRAPGDAALFADPAFDPLYTLPGAPFDALCTVAAYADVCAATRGRGRCRARVPVPGGHASALIVRLPADLAALARGLPGVRDGAAVVAVRGMPATRCVACGAEVEDLRAGIAAERALLRRIVGASRFEAVHLLASLVEDGIAYEALMP